MKARYSGALLRIADRLMENYEQEAVWERVIYDFAAHCENLMINTLNLYSLAFSVVLYNPQRR